MNMHAFGLSSIAFTPACPVPDCRRARLELLRDSLGSLRDHAHPDCMAARQVTPIKVNAIAGRRFAQAGIGGCRFKGGRAARWPPLPQTGRELGALAPRMLHSLDFDHVWVIEVALSRLDQADPASPSARVHTPVSYPGNARLQRMCGLIRMSAWRGQDLRHFLNLLLPIERKHSKGRAPHAKRPRPFGRAVPSKRVVRLFCALPGQPHRQLERRPKLAVGPSWLSDGAPISARRLRDDDFLVTTEDDAQVGASGGNKAPGVAP